MSTTMSKEELLNSIQEKMGQDFVSMSDLECPTSDFMMRYFVAALTAIGIDVNGMICHSKLQALTQRDTYRYNQQMSVFLAIQKVYPVPRHFKDFSLFCLIEPKPQDICFVALFDHFHSFWTERAQILLGPRIRNIEDKLQLLRDLKQRKEELQHKMNDFAAMRSKRAVEQTQLEQRLQVLAVELDHLQLENKLLTEQVVKEEAEYRDLLSKVESKRLQEEKRMELLEAEAEYKRLSQELGQLQAKRDEQEALLEEKRCALNEKVSRRRFMESCLKDEEQAMQALSEYLQLATKVENGQRNVLEATKKLKLILGNIKAEGKNLETVEDQRKVLENNIVSTEKNLAALVKQNDEYEKMFLYTSEIKEEITSFQAKSSELNEKISEKEQEFYNLENSFKRSQDKITEKIESATEFFKSCLRNPPEDEP